MYRLLIILLLLLTFSLKSVNLSASEKFDHPEYDTGVTSLMNAVAAADYKAIEFFIKINPLEIDKQNIGGASALHLAVRNNDPIAVKILIDHRSNPNLQDLEGYSPAMRACFYGFNDIFQIIQTNSSINYTLLNDQQDGFIILSALAKNSQCLEQALENIVPTRDLSVADLKDHLNRAFIISLAKEDAESKEILLKYLNRLHRFQKKIKQIESTQYRQAQELKNLSQMSSQPRRHDEYLRVSAKNFNAVEFDLKKPARYNNYKQRPVIINKSYELTRGSKGLKIEKPKPRKKYKIKKPKNAKTSKYSDKPKYKLESKNKTKIIEKPLAKKTPEKTQISQKPIIEKSRIVESGLARSTASAEKPIEGDLVIDESIM